MAAKTSSMNCIVAGFEVLVSRYRSRGLAGQLLQRAGPCQRQKPRGGARICGDRVCHEGDLLTREVACLSCRGHLGLVSQLLGSFSARLASPNELPAA